MDIFSTYYLNGVIVQNIRPMAKLFMQFFPSVIQSDKEEIITDYTKNHRARLTPFVHPMAKGKVVEGLGYSTKSLKPAYLKDIRAHYPHKYQKRMAGENFGGTMTTEQRMKAAIAADIQDQRDMLENRLEVMAAEAVIHGTATIKGEGFDSKVEFGRSASTFVTLSGTSAWNHADMTLGKIFGHLEDLAEQMRDHSGAVPNVFVMDSKAWQHIRNVIAKVGEEKINAWLDRSNKAADFIKLNLAPTIGAIDGLNFKGTFGDFPIYTFQSAYQDPEDGKIKQIMPENTLLMISSSQLDGVRHYGAIHDVDVMRPMPFYASSWIEKNPSVRMLQLESAPLLVPYRPDSVFTVKVA